MKKKITFVLILALIFCLTACASAPEYIKLTEADVLEALYAYLEPQVEAYRQAYGVDDLTVDLQLKGCDITLADEFTDGYASYKVRDVIVCPTITDKLVSGEFTDELLKQISAIQFDYDDFIWKDYEIFGYSVFAAPTFATAEGVEYSVVSEMVVRGDTIAYISEDADLAYDAKVGDSVTAILATAGDASSSKKEVCPTCNGTGYTKFYYGASDFEAFLDGYDPYTVGKCPMCG